MDLIADGLLIATALTAALYCYVLSRRLARLTDAGAGVGAQIAELSRTLAETRTAVAETRKSLAESRMAARNAGEGLAREVEGARDLVAELERAASAARRALPPEPAPRAEAERTASSSSSRMAEAEEGPLVLDDEIPDWPDGIVADPETEHGPDATPGRTAPPAAAGEAADAARPDGPASSPRAGTRLTVERMAL